MGQHGGGTAWVWGSMGVGQHGVWWYGVGGRKRILAMSIITIICICMMLDFTSNFTAAAGDTVLSGFSH